MEETRRAPGWESLVHPQVGDEVSGRGVRSHGQIAKAGMGSYCASEVGIEALSKQMAVELTPDGIAVNVVACGAIRTDINLPLYRSTKPQDVAR